MDDTGHISLLSLDQETMDAILIFLFGSRDNGRMLSIILLQLFATDFKCQPGMHIFDWKEKKIEKEKMAALQF